MAIPTPAMGYVRNNALKGHLFESLGAENRHLAHWETHVTDTLINHDESAVFNGNGHDSPAPPKCLGACSGVLYLEQQEPPD